MELALLGGGEYLEKILEAALDDIWQGHIPTDLGPLTTDNKVLNIWNDQEKYHTTSVALLAMSKNKDFDIIWHTQVMGMVGVLNLYLDPVLQYTWREASVMVSKVEGKTENHVHMCSSYASVLQLEKSVKD